MDRWLANTIGIAALAVGLALAGLTVWGCMGLAQQGYLFLQHGAEAEATIRDAAKDGEMHLDAVEDQAIITLKGLQDDVDKIAKKGIVHVF